MKRKHISLTTKLASALLALGDVPYDDAKKMSDEMIIGLYHFDHGIRHADGGTDDAYNLTPKLIAAHREKTAKIDIPQMAKSRRIREAELVHAVVMKIRDIVNEPAVARREPQRKLQSRGFAKGHRPLRGRPFAKT